ncbi:hypothetical protein J4419_03695 [Candidatus Woesearchaeota archaeon]|nr:hypothetical protein [Candidatus Woesearchaeota archaeon]
MEPDMKLKSDVTDVKIESDVKGWLEKLRTNAADLSRDEDLSIALMNLISLEEHLFFTAMKTDNQAYLDMLLEVRVVRTQMQARMVKDPEGEEWCISKHLLAASMRLYEVGTKELSKDRKAAWNAYTHAFRLYSLFFAINLKLVKPEKIAQSEALTQEEKKMSKFSALIKKIVDCCKEW